MIRYDPTMMRDYLMRVPRDRVALITDTQLLSFGDLLLGLQALPCPGFDGRIVALCIRDPAIALHAMAALDGRAAALLLASPSFSDSLIAYLAQRAGAQVLLTDEPARFGALDGLPPVIAVGTTPAGAEGIIEGQNIQSTRWLLSTSGTTSAPKLVSHPLQSLTRTTKLDLAYGAQVRWGLLYDYTRFAGLQVVLQSVLSGSTLVVPSLQAPLSSQVAHLAEHGCTHLSATPTLWRKLLMTPAISALRLRQITLGGEIVDQSILNALAQQFPQAKVRHIYASSEAGVGFSVADGREGFPTSFIDNPPAGISLRVVENRLFVRNEHVAPSYLGEETQFCDTDGFVDTGDDVTRRDDRYLFLGRANGTINVGGNKVHPETVERVLMAHPDVAVAKVGAKRSPITGALVAAEVLPSDPTIDGAELRNRLLSHCRAHLERHAVPALLTIVAELDLNSAGKIVREK